MSDNDSLERLWDMRGITRHSQEGDQGTTGQTIGRIIYFNRNMSTSDQGSSDRDSNRDPERKIKT